MSISSRPNCSDRDAAAVLRDVFGLKSTLVVRLPGERDLNFRIELTDATSVVLKICNESEPDEFLKAQDVVLGQLQSLPFVPQVVPPNESHLVQLHGQTWRARCVVFQPGISFAKVGAPSAELLKDLGTKLAQMDKQLVQLDLPILRRPFDWNLLDGQRVVQQYHHHISDERIATQVRRIADSASATVERHALALRQQIIHNDANDHNIVLAHDRDSHGERRVAAIIDFGDIAWSYLVAELAIAAAYVVCHREDPTRAIAQLIAGYHRVVPLRDEELICLLDLVMLRMCVSICMSAYQQGQRPDDAYLSISQAAMLRTLPSLEAINRALALAQLRAANGLPPLSQHRVVVDWMTQHAEFHPVMGTPLDDNNCLIVDLSVESAELDVASESIGLTSIQACARDGLFALGRYDEPRLIYNSDLFSGQHDGQQRTIHLGIDVFAPAGTEVFAVYDGEVAVCDFRNQAQDYGGVVILRHSLPDGECFHTLYGHLSEQSVSMWSVGDIVKQGETVGQLGQESENGGWPPHLHLQCIVDLLNLNGAFPGVAWAGERSLWTHLSPDPTCLVGITGELADRSRYPRRLDQLAARRRHLGSSLSLSYRQPLDLIRGWKQYLYDSDGRKFLDAYNNVPHVGHCHPRVVAATHQQLKTLNTNTRYLQSVVHEYVERLTQLLPDGLEVCFLLNSASEANELAIRLARQYTGRRGLVVQEAAYHGHTTTLIDASPYKHDGPGGQGAPDWIHVLPLPDTYRGRYRDGDAPQRYIEHASSALHRAATSRHPPGAFLAETWPSVGGQIVPPEGYLPAVYACMRSLNGLVIADEVQTGLGRLGSHFCAFEMYDLVPDIVVMGKPIGNGHPLAAVVTTREIAEAFDNGMEFFSTFGGNTVSAAAGLAVLDVLHDEQLPAQAYETGKLLHNGFMHIASSLSLIGDIRGGGLYWGLEMVRDVDAREPADTETQLVVNRMREKGILIGSDGPYHNVLKIRPPMPFTQGDASQLLQTLEEILRNEF